MSAHRPLPDLVELIGLFYSPAAKLGEFEELIAEELPPPYRELLAHNEHMTVTVEAFHGCPVDVQVLATNRGGDFYSRKILLRRQSDQGVVQFGIPRLNFAYLSPEVRDEIEAQAKPLGRVLIDHNVLRWVQLTALWRVTPGPELYQLFNLSAPRITYGRTALIYCDGEPAVELLEIVAPE